MKINNNQNKIEYSVVIPVYNADKTLNELFSRISSVFKKISSCYEVVFVDDSSQDLSWQKLLKLKEKNKKIKIIQLMRNYGQHNAIICGFGFCSGEYIITMDDDLQHPPEEIPKLIYAIKKHPNCDGVFATYKERKHNLFRRMGSLLISKINYYIFNIPSNLKSSSFRILRKQIVKILLTNKSHNLLIGPVLFSISHNFINIETDHDYCKNKASRYTLRKIINITLDNIINYSNLPLKIMSFMGIFASFFSFLLIISLIIEKMTNSNILPGWTSLMIINLFFFGLILFSIGIIGEYLIRIMQQLKTTAQYAIRSKKI